MSKDDANIFQEPNRSSYAIIPSYILDDDSLDEGAKNLYARISMYSQDGRCWATNKHFADKHKVDVRTIQRWLSELKDAGYITIDVDSSGFQTTRDIWITVDFKKFSTARHTRHPGMQPMSPTHATNVMTYNETNTSKTNIKQQQAAAVPIQKKEKQQQQPKIYDCLKQIDRDLVPLEQKIEITRKFDEKRVTNGLNFTEQNKHKIDKSYVAYLIWAIKEGLEATATPSEEKSNRIDSNKEFAKQYDGVESEFFRVDALNSGIEIVCKTGNRSPFILPYTSPGFVEQLESQLRKSDIRIKNKEHAKNNVGIPHQDD